MSLKIYGYGEGLIFQKHFFELKEIKQACWQSSNC